MADVANSLFQLGRDIRTGFGDIGESQRQLGILGLQGKQLEYNVAKDIEARSLARAQEARAAERWGIEKQVGEAGLVSAQWNAEKIQRERARETSPFLYTDLTNMMSPDQKVTWGVNLVPDFEQVLGAKYSPQTRTFIRESTNQPVTNLEVQQASFDLGARMLAKTSFGKILEAERDNPQTSSQRRQQIATMLKDPATIYQKKADVLANTIAQFGANLDPAIKAILADSLTEARSNARFYEGRKMTEEQRAQYDKQMLVLERQLKLIEKQMAAADRTGQGVGLKSKDLISAYRDSYIDASKELDKYRDEGTGRVKDPAKTVFDKRGRVVSQANLSPDQEQQWILNRSNQLLRQRLELIGGMTPGQGGGLLRERTQEPLPSPATVTMPQGEGVLQYGVSPTAFLASQKTPTTANVTPQGARTVQANLLGMPRPSMPAENLTLGEMGRLGVKVLPRMSPMGIGRTAVEAVAPYIKDFYAQPYAQDIKGLEDWSAAQSKYIAEHPEMVDVESFKNMATETHDYWKGVGKWKIPGTSVFRSFLGD